MTTKYYSSTIPYYKRTTPVLLRTTKYYSSTKGLIERRQDCHFSAIDAYDSTIRVAPTTTKLQFYYSFARLTRTSLRKGCSVNSKISILLQFRAIDTHDLTKGLLRKQQNLDFTRDRRAHFTTVSRDRHVLSYERLAFPQAFSGPWRPPPYYLSKILSKESK